MISKIISRILPHMPEKLVWQVSKTYIAGESVEDAVAASRALNREQTMVTIDILGEFIENMDQAKVNRDEYIHLIREIENQDIHGNYSVKPTMFGLLLDEEICYEYIREIVATAASFNNFIRIDMEDSPCVDMSIKLFRRIKQEFPDNIGLVLQAYLRRTLSDMESMLDLKTDTIDLNFRLCKGIYVEPPEIAYQDYHEINTHYLEDLEFMMKNGVYAAIATHDKPVIQGALDLIKKYDLPRERYEFQMLYGVTPKQRRKLVRQGHRVRVYVPYGKHWFGYSTRRLKENPNMVSHVVKAFFQKG
ncbi:proline dehydrogenase family protein [Desulfospira joergensenii]|uniref:proline dehydrogenase family protein n=1 Tax=Desulfospira joergensenii TaxID=53329 RepID=UPI0003B5124F|nr:proline dehydrogenase family protein [Desulfospira joergensenii]